MISPAMMDLTINAVQNNLHPDLLKTNQQYSHWSQHFTTLGALVMSITAVAAAILLIYPLAAICAFSALTHLIAGHYIGEFLVYKQFEVASEALRQRNRELAQNVQQLSAALTKINGLNLELFNGLAQHEAVDADFRRRLDADLATLGNTANHLEAANLVAKHVAETAQKITSSVANTAAQLQGLNQVLQNKQTLIQQLSQSISDLGTNLMAIATQNQISEQRVASLESALKTTDNLLRQHQVDSVAQTEELNQELAAAQVMIQKLQAKIKTLKTENSALKTENTRLQALAPAPAAAH